MCHSGPASEAGQDCCFAKFAAVPPGPGVGERLGGLLDACAMVAREGGMPNVLAGVNLAREEAYRTMLARDFCAMIQGVTMRRRNEPGYSVSGHFVLEDWR